MAGNYVKKLLGLGVIREVTKGRKNKRFVNDDVLQIIFEPFGESPGARARVR